MDASKLLHQSLASIVSDGNHRNDVFDAPCHSHSRRNRVCVARCLRAKDGSYEFMDGAVAVAVTDSVVRGENADRCGLYVRCIR
ncbi:hypothetical protein EXIGLDRAFT_726994 [Exidia glandulosa HHB12029]|uniref:Uncharacterized protein n=1 Tax=Exidia glandulosa HHB12029 TaxID=1314781 RepID=A0A165DI87_EXIGL|nr:hypothetical protein EXIGLDRAFT_726994 [Exidia glandulosa HHB12029]